MAIFIYIFLIMIIMLTSRHLVKFLLLKYKSPFKFESYSDFIPSKKLIDNKFILSKNGDYSLIIKLDGASYYESEDLEAAKLASYNIKNRVLNLKDIEDSIDIKFFFKRFKTSDKGFINSNYIEITSNNKKNLEDIAARFINGLSNFNAIIIKDLEIIEFLYAHCNLLHRKVDNELSDYVNNSMHLSDFFGAVEIDFNNDYGELHKLEHKKYFKCFTLDFGSSINDKYFLDILTANFECEYIINSKFFNKIKADMAISIDKKNITASSSPTEGKLSHSKFEASNKKINEIKETQELLDNEEASLIVLDIFIIVYANTPSELNDISRQLKDIVNKYEIYLSEETHFLNFFFLQRLVGFRMHNTMLKFVIPYGDTLVYARKMLSCTLAGLIDYVKTPCGLTKCDWGIQPIATFSTNYNSLYNFYFHVNEGNAAVGHGVIIAPTGGGKTTLIQYLIKGTLDNYSDIDIYSFDRFNGMSIFTNWQQGKDISFDSLAINPLQIDLDILENKEFLNSLLIMLAKADSSKDKEAINGFVNMISTVPIKERLLKTLVKECLADSPLKDNLNVWCEGKYQHYLNAISDNFNLDKNFVNFQMDKILDDEDLSAPIVSYIMFKIRQKARMTGRGHFVFIDETAKMIKNPFFRYQAQIFLDEHRKLRGCIWLAFQNANAFLEDPLCQSILNQCQNRIVFASDGINDNTINKLQIDKSIYNEVKSAQKNYNNPYFVLLKRPNENVILNINLKDKIDLKFLSSSAYDVNRMRSLQEEHGSEWCQYF